MGKPWEQNREIITKLYRDDDLTLAEVMKIMKEQHGFSASKRAYHCHFSLWQVDKNDCRMRNEKRQQQQSSLLSPVSTLADSRSRSNSFSSLGPERALRSQQLLTASSNIRNSVPVMLGSHSSSFPHTLSSQNLVPRIDEIAEYTHMTPGFVPQALPSPSSPESPSPGTYNRTLPANSDGPHANQRSPAMPGVTMQTQHCEPIHPASDESGMRHPFLRAPQLLRQASDPDSFHEVVRKGDVDGMHRFLRSGVNVDSRRDFDGATPAHLARSPEVLQILSQYDANFGITDSQGNTPLHSLLMDYPSPDEWWSSEAPRGTAVRLLRCYQEQQSTTMYPLWDVQNTLGLTALHLVINLTTDLFSGCQNAFLSTFLDSSPDITVNFPDGSPVFRTLLRKLRDYPQRSLPSRLGLNRATAASTPEGWKLVEQLLVEAIKLLPQQDLPPALCDMLNPSMRVMTLRNLHGVVDWIIEHTDNTPHVDSRGNSALHCLLSRGDQVLDGEAKHYRVNRRPPARSVGTRQLQPKDGTSICTGEYEVRLVNTLQKLLSKMDLGCLSLRDAQGCSPMELLLAGWLTQPLFWKLSSLLVEHGADISEWADSSFTYALSEMGPNIIQIQKLASQPSSATPLWVRIWLSMCQMAESTTISLMEPQFRSLAAALEVAGSSALQQSPGGSELPLAAYTQPHPPLMCHEHLEPAFKVILERQLSSRRDLLSEFYSIGNATPTQTWQFSSSMSSAGADEMAAEYVQLMKQVVYRPCVRLDPTYYEFMVNLHTYGV